MGYSSKLRGAVCFTALFVGGAANADVTAQQVWDSWKSQMSMYPETALTTTSEDMSGDTLTVTGLSVKTTSPEMSTEVAIDQMTFEEQGDGSVRITMSESYPMTFTAQSGAVITVDTTYSGLEMVVTGDDTELNYDVSVETAKLALRDVVDGDVTFTGDVTLMVSDMTGSYSTSETETNNITYDVDIASIDLLVDVKVPGGKGEYVTGGGKIEGINMQATMALPLEMDAEHPENFFKDGFAMDGGYTVDGSSFIFDVNADGGQAAGAFSAGATTLAVEFNNDKVAYDTNSENIAFSITGSEIPFPVEIALDKYNVGFEMPLGKADEPQDFRLSLGLVDLSINDIIWGMFDPASVLPRDPATIEIAVSGTATPLINVFDPDQTMLMNGVSPVELNTLSIDKLNIAAVGATVTGDGAFTFDPSDMQSFAPLPRPEGEASVQINGLNALIDNLVAMGLIPEDQVMGPRMMLGMFARTTGDDQLETTVEVNDEGHLLVNGQRMK